MRKFVMKAIGVCFKLSFGRSQVDVCGVRETFSAKLKKKFLSDADKKFINVEKMVHIHQSKKFNTAMKFDSEQKDSSVLSIVFDYMQNVYLPHIPVQELFYMRQITVNVFCMHNLQKNKSRLYVYDESQAKKGPNEVCTFLFDYISEYLEKNKTVTSLHLYSDNCGGQNKNHTVLRFMKALTDNGIIQEAVFSLPMRGHSFNACDRDFGVIKCHMKKTDRIYTIRKVGLIFFSQ